MATLNRLPIQRAEIEIPYRRIWTARVTFTDATGPAVGDSAELVLGNLALIGTVIDADTFGGVATARVVAGAGGWRTVPQGLAFQNDANLSALDIAQALGKSVNETVIGTGESVGVNWSFDPTASAASNMDSLGSWYVREDGVTVLGTREEGREVNSVVEDFDQVRARATIPVEESALASYVPGNVVTSETLREPLPIRHTRILLTAERIYVEASSREQNPDRLFAHVAKRLRFLGTYTYRIIEQVGERLQLQAVDTIDGLPDQLLVDKAHGLPGVLSDCTASGECLVQFADGKPSLPRVVGFLGGATTIYMSSRTADENVMLARHIVALIKPLSDFFVGTLATLVAGGMIISPADAAAFAAAAAAFKAPGAPNVQTAQLKAPPIGPTPPPVP